MWNLEYIRRILMTITQTDPSEFIATLPKEYQDEVVILDRYISSAMRKLPRVMWEGILWGGTDQQIIGYGSTSHTKKGSPPTDWFIVGLAVQKNYISLYINVPEGKQVFTQKYKKKLGKAKIGKTTISFKSISDIYLDELVKMIKNARQLALANT